MGNAAWVRGRQSEVTHATPRPSRVIAPPQDDLSDLMRRSQDGDAASYARLLRLIAPLVRAVGRRQGLQPAATDDLAQDVMLTIHRVRHTYDPARPFLPWLIAIAHRRTIDLLRRDGRVRARELSVPELLETFADESASDAVEDEEQRAILRAAIATLPPRQREALDLVKVREMSVAEAAARSGQSPGSIKVNVHRAIKSLRARMVKT